MDRQDLQDLEVHPVHREGSYINCLRSNLILQIPERSCERSHLNSSGK